MKRFIRYLYEYEQRKRIRNVGFVKVETGNEETIVQMQGKGFHNSLDRRIVLYLFYEENGEIIGIRQTDVNLVSPALSYQLIYNETNVGVPGNYDKIKGILIETASGRRMAATWDDRPVDVSRMEEFVAREMPLSLGSEPTEPGRQETSGGQEPQRSVDLRPEAPEPGRQEESSGQEPQKDNDLRPEPTAPEQQTAPVPNNPEQQIAPESTTPEQQIAPAGKTITKISRRDLAKLPRCEWKLANNQFLIHGYKNYHHLIMIQEENILKLGVPGIYHIEEARCADIFGFGEFLSLQEIDISLTAEEQNESEPFGYWCRPVKNYCSSIK